MTALIILISAIILLCILANRFSSRFGMPALILFMFIGMLFGSDGIVKIPFSDFHQAESICTAALLFIMFYGGFNTKWSAARQVAAKSITLSTIGVLFTAGITACLCHLVLGFSVPESFLIGAVLSSTDAASVFSILRQKNLNLKDGTASLLEIESGSNDPVAYMLTLVGIQIVKTGHTEHIGRMIFMQTICSAAIGIAFAMLSIYILTRTNLVAESMQTVYLIAAILLCSGLSILIGGNEYLSVYLMGIIIGNSRLKNKDTIIPFFDGVTELAHMLIFFLLGLLTFPHRMPEIIIPALAIVIFLTLIARPISVFVLMLPFKCSIRQCLLISWAGLRGAASSVFAIIAVASGTDLSYDLFHIVFMVSLFSVGIQGTLLPKAADMLDMIDDTADVRKTFNDYQEESAITLMRMYIPDDHSWVNKKIKEVNLPTNSLALMIKRGKNTIITKGNTTILAGDTMILSVPSYEPSENEQLDEIYIDKNHPWCGKMISELHLKSDELIALVIRGNENLIPDGKTEIQKDDIVVIYK